MIHDLKTWPGPFDAVLSGVKRYEIHKADRPYAVGDELHLREWVPCPKCNGTGRMWDNGDMTQCRCMGGPPSTWRGAYTGREAWAHVLYLTPGGEWGLPADLCVMSIQVGRTKGVYARPLQDDDGRDRRGDDL